jgi:phenylpropionate dioxygenase-like ring-hydroxylating dioxygenase large terminal subunit
MADIDPGLSPSAQRARAAAAILERLVAHAATRETDRAESALALPKQVYTSPERYDLEKQALFHRMPLVAGLSQDIPNPGDVMLFEAAGPSIIVGRGKDGTVRAFRNICTHRAAKLLLGEEATCQRKPRLTCPFHAWTFDLEGRLIAQPGKAGFEDHPDGARPLMPVSAREWNGILFVQIEGEMDLEAHLGDFAPLLAMMELGTAEPVKRGHIDCRANWKYALDTYGEGYHFASLHPNNIAITHLSDVAVFDPYGRHHRVSFPTKAMADLASKPHEEWPTTDYNGVHFLFPNTVFFIGSVEPGKTFVQLFRLFPSSVGQMRCQFAVYAPGGVRDEAHRRESEMGYDMTEQVVRTEDYAQSEQSFANLLEAPEDFHVILGSNEIALQRLHRNIGEAIGRPIAG